MNDPRDTTNSCRDKEKNNKEGPVFDIREQIHKTARPFCVAKSLIPFLSTHEVLSCISNVVFVFSFYSWIRFYGVCFLRFTLQLFDINCFLVTWRESRRKMPASFCYNSVALTTVFLCCALYCIVYWALLDIIRMSGVILLRTVWIVKRRDHSLVRDRPS